MAHRCFSNLRNKLWHRSTDIDGHDISLQCWMHHYTGNQGFWPKFDQIIVSCKIMTHKNISMFLFKPPGSESAKEPRKTYHRLLQIHVVEDQRYRPGATVRRPAPVAEGWRGRQSLLWNYQQGKIDDNCFINFFKLQIPDVTHSSEEDALGRVCFLHRFKAELVFPPSGEIWW